ncbi:MAG: hypothetical protein JSS71_03025 [Armatimonadetes bacterium]|nr:hypothetical protein [Armatimonadota bacterium]MBX3108355.1 hypothetical protein [Fimbriimonadaceae bacterium]
MSKSPSTRLALGLFGWAFVAACGWFGYRYAESVVNTDALAAYRGQDNGPFGNAGVLVKGFQIKSYQGGKLVSEALVDEATIRSDRSSITLHGIRQGQFYGKGDKQYRFEAAGAEYGTYSKSILAEGGVRIWNKSLDLKSAGFLYDNSARQVTVNGDVTGTMEGGKLASKDVVLLLEPDAINTGEIKWAGPITIQEGKKTPWQVEAKRSTIRNGIYTYESAKGQDKETIVKADKMSYDRDKDIVVAEGHVEYFGVDANLSCDKAVIERKIGKATLTGKVVNMLVKAEGSAPKEAAIPPVSPIVPDSIAGNRPKAPPDDQQDPVRNSDNIRDYPIAMRAGQIEYWYRNGERRAILTIDPFARQELGALKWREVSASRAEYDAEKEFLVLRSSGGQPVRLKNSVGDDMTATFMQVSTKKGDDSMDAENLKGTVMIDDNQLPEKPAGSGGGGGGNPGGKGLNGKIGGR